MEGGSGRACVLAAIDIVVRERWEAVLVLKGGEDG